MSSSRYVVTSPEDASRPAMAAQAWAASSSSSAVADGEVKVQPLAASASRPTSSSSSSAARAAGITDVTAADGVGPAASPAPLSSRRVTRKAVVHPSIDSTLAAVEQDMHVASPSSARSSAAPHGGGGGGAEQPLLSSTTESSDGPARATSPAVELTVNIDASAAGGTATGTAVATATPNVLASPSVTNAASTATPGGSIAAPSSPKGSSSMLSQQVKATIQRKAVVPSKSKMMALVGEMLPSNALDPTGFENHEEETRQRAERLAQENEDELEEGHVEMDQFGNKIYSSLRAKLRYQLRRKWRGCWKVYDPASPNRQYWSLLVVGFLLYGMVEIPLRIGFEQDVTPWSGADIFNLLVDIFFLADVVMNFRTGYFQDDSRLVLDERKIAARYIRSWFALDLITSIPLSHIMQALLHSSSGMAALALPRLLRIFRMARLFKILRMLKLMNVMSSWSESSNEKLFSLLLKVLKFVTLVFMLSHLSGCAWGYIALQEKDSEGNFNPSSWPYKYGIYNYNRDTTFASMYLLSLYWAMTTLTTTGYGDISASSAPEYGFCIVLTFVGTCCFGYIIGTISSILKHGKEAEEKYAHRMMELNLYMSYRKISPYLQKKVRAHYEYMYKSQAMYEESTIIDELPAHLQAELSNHLYKDFIAKVPFLADMGPEVSLHGHTQCAMLVILRLKPMQIAPGSFIFTKGALGREMFFVSKGTVDVVDGSGFILCQLQEGSYFGEYAILSEKPVYRTASIRARTFVDLLSLSKLDFEYISALFPEIYAKIILRAKNQWTSAMADLQRKREEDATMMALMNPSSTPAPMTKGPTIGPGKMKGSRNLLGVIGETTAATANGTAGAGDTVIRIDKTAAGNIEGGEPIPATRKGSEEKVLSPVTPPPLNRTKLSVVTSSSSTGDFNATPHRGSGGSSHLELLSTPLTVAEARAVARLPREHALGEHTVLRSVTHAEKTAAAEKAAAALSSKPSMRNALASSDDDDMDGGPSAESSRTGGPNSSPKAGGGGSTHLDEYDSDDYYDSLEGLSSENDEDYDAKSDAIDLPEHLLPPPRPIIRGSFVPPEMVVHSQAAHSLHHNNLQVQGARRFRHQIFSGGGNQGGGPAGQLRRRGMAGGGQATPTTTGGKILHFLAATGDALLSGGSSGGGLSTPDAMAQRRHERQAALDRASARQKGGLVRHSSNSVVRKLSTDGAGGGATPILGPSTPGSGPIGAGGEIEMLSPGGGDKRNSAKKNPGPLLPVAGSSRYVSPAEERAQARRRNTFDPSEKSFDADVAAAELARVNAASVGANASSAVAAATPGSDADTEDDGTDRPPGPLLAPAAQIALAEKEKAASGAIIARGSIFSAAAAGGGAGAANAQKLVSDAVAELNGIAEDEEEDSARGNSADSSILPGTVATAVPQLDADSVLHGSSVGNVGLGSTAAPGVEEGATTPRLKLHLSAARDRSTSGAAPSSARRPSSAQRSAYAHPPAHHAPAVPFPHSSAGAGAAAAVVDPTASPLFWESLQKVLASSMAPLQNQYSALVSEHAQLQAKQQHTEHLLRTVVAKLKEERAATAKQQQQLSPSSPTPSRSHSPGGTRDGTVSPLISPNNTSGNAVPRIPRKTYSGGPVMKKDDA